jgi:hypothetical protein
MPLPLDPGGRLDVALVRVGEVICRGAIEPRLGFPVWDRGVGEFVAAFVSERLKVPSKVFTVTDLARELGVLPPARKLVGKGER